MRLAPKESTLKRLFALSGNQCAFPGCAQPLVDIDGHLTGQVCHIEAAEPGGERYNPAQSDEDRREFENLLLLCTLCRARHKEHYADSLIMPSRAVLSTERLLSDAA